MGKVRWRAGVLGVTAAAVFAIVPVAAFAQLPSVDDVVGGVPDPTGVVGDPPPLPSLPSNPVPVQPPAVPAPAPPAVHAPSVQAPAAPEPVGSLLQQHSSPSAGGGPSSGAGAGGPGAGSVSTRSGATTGAAGTRGHAGRRARSHASGAHKSRRGDHGGSSKDGAGANAAGDEAASAFGEQLAMAENAADPLPDNPRPAKSPFTGFALSLLVLTGLCALGTGLAIRRGAGRVGLHRVMS